jgi:Family of unknown function (DUF5715)
LPAVLQNSLLSGYRATVEDLVDEARSYARLSDLPAVERLVARRLRQPELTALLTNLDAGADVAADGILREVRSYRQPACAETSSLPTFIRSILLSQIDSIWWSGALHFVSDTEVLSSTELVDLGPLRSARKLEFQYRTQPAGLPGRARDWAQHKVRPRARPRLAGMRFTRARSAVVAVVNQISREFATAMPPRTPRLWVTSMVRSVEYQYRLRALGYAAVVPSSHCAGYACDLELQWFRQFDPDNVLARLLRQRQDAGQLNVIDEGRTWHLCVSPHACHELQAAYDDQLRVP